MRSLHMQHVLPFLPPLLLFSGLRLVAFEPWVELPGLRGSDFRVSSSPVFLFEPEQTKQP